MEKLALISRQEWMLTLFLQLGGIRKNTLQQILVLLILKIYLVKKL